jgi:hypothetical protein
MDYAFYVWITGTLTSLGMVVAAIVGLLEDSVDINEAVRSYWCVRPCSVCAEWRRLRVLVSGYR